jgi:hypothetical protein
VAVPEDYEGLPFCGVSEPVAFGELRRDPAARWWVEGGLTSLSRDQVRLAVRLAFERWSAVANVAGEEAPSAQQAHLLVRPARIDGPQGVLADCVLPGPPVQLMRLDQGERWVLQLGADIPGNVIDLNRVMAHELGHFWGLGHAPPGSPNLMAPTYSRSIWEPRGPWEVERMVAVYGPPKPAQPQPGENRVPSVVSIYDQYGEVLSSYELGKRLE